MKRVFANTLLILLSGLLLSACQKRESQLAKVTAAPKSGSEKKSDQKTDVNAPVEISSLSAEDNLKALLKMNKKADQIFTQAWDVYWNDSTKKPFSVFKALVSALDSQYSCSADAFSSVQGFCEAKLGDHVVAQIKATKDSQGLSYYLLTFTKESLWVGKFLSTFGSVEFDSEEKDESKAYNLKSLPVVCSLYPDTRLGLRAMSCRDLGHDFSAQNYAVFKTFQWVANKEVNGLKANGFRIKYDENGPRPETQFEMVENSKENTITINEKEIGGKKQEKTRTVKASEDSQPQAQQAPKELSQEEVQNKADAVLNQALQSAVSGDQAVDPSQINAVTGEVEQSPEQSATSQGVPAVR